MDEHSSLLKQQDLHSDCVHSLSHIYFSETCGVFYILMILLSAITIGWTVANFGEFPRDSWFLALEICLSFIVISEVLLRYTIQGYSTFTSNSSNLFDLCVVLLSMFSLYIAILSTGFLGDIEGLSADVLMIFHFSAQYLRLAMFLKNKTNSTINPIRLSQL